MVLAKATKVTRDIRVGSTQGDIKVALDGVDVLLQRSQLWLFPAPRIGLEQGEFSSITSGDQGLKGQVKLLQLSLRSDQQAWDHIGDSGRVDGRSPFLEHSDDLDEDDVDVGDLVTKSMKTARQCLAQLPKLHKRPAGLFSQSSDGNRTRRDGQRIRSPSTFQLDQLWMSFVGLLEVPEAQEDTR